MYMVFIQFKAIFYWCGNWIEIGLEKDIGKVNIHWFFYLHRRALFYTPTKNWQKSRSNSTPSNTTTVRELASLPVWHPTLETLSVSFSHCWVIRRCPSLSTGSDRAWPIWTSVKWYLTRAGLYHKASPGSTR